ncbi:hypothetical protein C5167_031388 [Papaver somniferum]|uniref:YDG domain-containing protein n=1 Tax=Papaver somniferum TaxID=3469 RepID=A0A4Y7K5N1_PAPSO|nr:hypothetical protein C5167_031388 [Papaver somniferum]
MYTYSGLYSVIECLPDIGDSGYRIYRYTLERLEGQPPLATNQLVCQDISGGNENFPIRAINLVDNPPFAPACLTYVTTNQISANVTMPKAPTDASAKEHVPIQGHVPVQGLMVQTSLMNLFKDGGRSRDFIPVGAFICEYIGEIKRSDETRDPENFYIMDIYCLQSMKGLGGREKRFKEVAINETALLDKEDDKVDICIEIPELPCVLSDHHDPGFARIVLFTNDNIAPYQELSYDYGYSANSVVHKNGELYEQIRCSCDAPDCKKHMY